MRTRFHLRALGTDLSSVPVFLSWLAILRRKHASSQFTIRDCNCGNGFGFV